MLRTLNIEEVALVSGGMEAEDQYGAVNEGGGYFDDASLGADNVSAADTNTTYQLPDGSYSGPEVVVEAPFSKAEMAQMLDEAQTTTDLQFTTGGVALGLATGGPVAGAIATGGSGLVLTNHYAYDKQTEINLENIMKRQMAIKQNQTHYGNGYPVLQYQ